MSVLLFASQMLPPGPTSFPRRDVFWLGVVLLLAGIVMVIVVRRVREMQRDDETLEGP